MSGVNVLIAEVADPQGMKHIQLTLSDETGSLNVVYVITLASAKKVCEGLAATIKRAESGIIIPGNSSHGSINCCEVADCRGRKVPGTAYCSIHQKEL